MNKHATFGQPNWRSSTLVTAVGPEMVDTTGEMSPASTARRGMKGGIAREGACVPHRPAHAKTRPAPAAVLVSSYVTTHTPDASEPSSHSQRPADLVNGGYQLIRFLPLDPTGRELARTCGLQTAIWAFAAALESLKGRRSRGSAPQRLTLPDRPRASCISRFGGKNRIS